MKDAGLYLGYFPEMVKDYVQLMERIHKSKNADDRVKALHADLYELYDERSGDELPNMDDYNKKFSDILLKHQV